MALPQKPFSILWWPLVANVNLYTPSSELAPEWTTQEAGYLFRFFVCLFSFVFKIPKGGNFTISHISAFHCPYVFIGCHLKKVKLIYLVEHSVYKEILRNQETFFPFSWPLSEHSGAKLVLILLPHWTRSLWIASPDTPSLPFHLAPHQAIPISWSILPSPLRCNMAEITFYSGPTHITEAVRSYTWVGEGVD